VTINKRKTCIPVLAGRQRRSSAMGHFRPQASFSSMSASLRTCPITDCQLPAPNLPFVVAAANFFSWRKRQMKRMRRLPEFASPGRAWYGSRARSDRGLYVWCSRGRPSPPSPVLESLGEPISNNIPVAYPNFPSFPRTDDFNEFLVMAIWGGISSMHKAGGSLYANAFVVVMLNTLLSSLCISSGTTARAAKSSRPSATHRP